ncbi:hypothetical protein SEA_CAFASSO_52 [Gordonia phage Cafasso]|uniref:Uncharacterized protein n=1 Tax=Gordonia phage Cafasso TaxID=2851095 RepID=A0AAE7SEY4_9CAUD|nr:hypothetical protein SEA_CAFASSO_52 [Gordonia phage Cafasso]
MTDTDTTLLTERASAAFVIDMAHLRHGDEALAFAFGKAICALDDMILERTGHRINPASVQRRNITQRTDFSTGKRRYEATYRPVSVVLLGGPCDGRTLDLEIAEDEPMCSYLPVQSLERSPRWPSVVTERTNTYIPAGIDVARDRWVFTCDNGRRSA